MNKGDTCVECLTGKVYKTEPGSLLRITGQSPFKPEQHVTERLRCNTCGAYFTAPLPEDVLTDGTSAQKYGYSARSLMAIYKYFAGLPFYRQSSIQKLLGVKITASTVFDQVELVCNDIYPVYQLLFNLASDAKHYYLDDTTNRILDAKPIEKKARNSDKTRTRTGVYTSGVIATLTDNRDIVLFETNIGHAGEFIDSILHKRSQSCAKPLIMSDALASNRPTVREAITSLCNSHARRQFVDVINHFPEEVEHVLNRYGEIWGNDDYTKEEKLTPSARLIYHQQHSMPIMQEIKLWGETHFANETVEENSGLGKAIRYFIKHYVGLSHFCNTEGVKIDNNRIEAMLKIIVRDRNYVHLPIMLSWKCKALVIQGFTPVVVHIITSYPSRPECLLMVHMSDSGLQPQIILPRLLVSFPGRLPCIDVLFLLFHDQATELSRLNQRLIATSALRLCA